jgi:hypothetical protein
MVDKSDFLNYTFEIKFPDKTQKFTTEDELASLDSGLPKKSHGMPYFKYNNMPYVYQIPATNKDKWKPLGLPASPKFEDVVNKILDYMNIQKKSRSRRRTSRKNKTRIHCKRKIRRTKRTRIMGIYHRTGSFRITTR